MIELSVSAASNVGLRREHNEDMALYGRSLLRDDVAETKCLLTENDRFLVAVADGIGGANGGEIASETILRSLRSTFYDLPMFMENRNIMKSMKRWLKAANKQLEHIGCADFSLHGLGTTLVSILFYEGNALWMNCGDSRIYRLRSGILTQLSTDHSLDRITGRECDSHVLVNSIGAGSDSYLEFGDMTDCILDGDEYLLCSDGLSDMVDDNDIESVLIRGEGVGGLVDLALKNGGRDNVTVSLIKIHLL